MALESLLGLTEIDGEEIVNMTALKETNPELFRPDGSMHYELFEKNIRPYKHIYVRHDVNSISFTVQNGPIKEVGKNGCQLTALIQVAKEMITHLNKSFPCVENLKSIECLNQALDWQAERTENRQKREVEGLSQL